MKGEILFFDLAQNIGIINGSDGKRYEFDSSSWKETNHFPERGACVDFIDNDGVATEIYLSLESQQRNSKTQSISKKILNTSGSKDFFENTVSVPDEIKEWNWGAILLTPLWSIGNHFWWGLFCLVPYAGLGVSILLGIKGNEMAWKAKRWRSIEEFKNAQKNWAIAGFIVLGIGFTIGILTSIE